MRTPPDRPGRRRLTGPGPGAGAASSGPLDGAAITELTRLGLLETGSGVSRPVVLAGGGGAPGGAGGGELAAGKGGASSFPTSAGGLDISATATNPSSGPDAGGSDGIGGGPGITARQAGQATFTGVGIARSAVGPAP